jgi:hypothetical protein
MVETERMLVVEMVEMGGVTVRQVAAVVVLVQTRVVVEFKLRLGGREETEVLVAAVGAAAADGAARTLDFRPVGAAAAAMPVGVEVALESIVVLAVAAAAAAGAITQTLPFQTYQALSVAEEAQEEMAK